MYPAPEYADFDKQLLEDLGVQKMTWKEIFPRLQADLLSRSSRIHTRKRDSPWYEAFADLGLSALKATSNTPVMFRKQSLICLSKVSQWTGAPGMGFGGQKNIYFPTTGTVSVPDDIGLPLADRTASANPKVRELYAALGVEECSKGTIYAAIEAAQASDSASLNLNSHLQYLFQTDCEPSEVKPWLLVPTDRGPKGSGRRLYFASHAAYHLDQLLPRDIRHDNNLACSVIPEEVLKLEPLNLRIDKRTWLTWLKEATGARYHPQLTRKGYSGTELSTDLCKVVELYPSKFLGTLKAHWSEYRHKASQVRDLLKECRVPCMFGKSHFLHATYLPTSQILDKIDELGIDVSAIAVLDLPDGQIDEDQYREWRFLEDFGVCAKPDLQFYKSALEELYYMDGLNIAQAKRAYRSMALLATIGDQEDLR